MQLWLTRSKDEDQSKGLCCKGKERRVNNVQGLEKTMKLYRAGANNHALNNSEKI